MYHPSVVPMSYCSTTAQLVHLMPLIQLPPLTQPLTTLLPSSEWFSTTANTEDITDPQMQRLCLNKLITNMAPAILYVQ
jgi:hypothetical protein